LTVQQKTIGRNRPVAPDALYRSRPESDFPTVQERHDCADGKTAGDAGWQPPYSVIVPHPSPLKVWKLDSTILDVIKKFLQPHRMGFEHWNSLYLFDLPIVTV